MSRFFYLRSNGHPFGSNRLIFIEKISFLEYPELFYRVSFLLIFFIKNDDETIEKAVE